MSVLWKIPRMWDSQPCVIMGGGKSLTPEVVEAVRLASAYRVIVINEAYKLAPWADLLYAADRDWWHVNKGAPEFHGMKVTCEPNGFADVMELKASATTGLSADPSTVTTGGNSGYQAVGIAVHAGCSRVLLCGFDMKPGHWHSEHKPPLRKTNPEQYKTWIERFHTLVKPLSAAGVEVINCSPGSALNAFPHIPLAIELERYKKVA